MQQWEGAPWWRVRSSRTGCTAPALLGTFLHGRAWGCGTTPWTVCLSQAHLDCPGDFCLDILRKPGAKAYTIWWLLLWPKEKRRHVFKYQKSASHRKGFAAWFTGFMTTTEARVLCAILDHWCWVKHWTLCALLPVCFYLLLCRCAWCEWVCTMCAHVCVMWRSEDSHEDLVLSFYFLHGFGD